MSARRGQNMLLLTLALFLLALMVTMTLGIASRIRENHELQTLADAAAYSGAVVNARAYNNMSIVNRLEVSYWVAMAADESIISWTSYAVAALSAAINGAKALGSTSTMPDGCAANDDEADALYDSLVAEYGVLIPSNAAWDTGDHLVGAEALQIQGKISQLREEIREPPNGVAYKLYQERAQQQIAKQIVQNSRIGGLRVIEGGGGFSPTQGPNFVSRREVGCDWNGGPGGPGQNGTGICSNAAWNENMLEAALGTRANGFLRTRGVVPARIAAIFGRFIGQNGVDAISISGPVGEGYWSSSRDGTHTTVFAWGDDHGVVTTTVSDVGGACTRTQALPALAFVKSTDRADRSDQHEIVPKAQLPVDVAEPPDERHTMGSCANSCPSVWVRTPTFQPDETANRERNAHGQPKTVVALERDYADAAYQRPWELNFRFRFSAQGSTFDNRGERLVTSGLDISKASAFATGITYYHRKQQWREHPNLLNPFWRATLVPADVDRDTAIATNASSDIADVSTSYFQGDHRWQADAYRQMVVNAGFRGLH